MEQEKTAQEIQHEAIQKELADCRAAIAANPGVVMFWNLHHEDELEILSEPVEARIEYILTNKPKDEQAIRFKNLRPALSIPEELKAAAAAYHPAIIEGERLDQAFYRSPYCSPGMSQEEQEARDARDKYRSEVRWPLARAYQLAYSHFSEDAQAAAHKADVPETTWGDHGSIFPKDYEG